MTLESLNERLTECERWRSAAESEITRLLAANLMMAGEISRLRQELSERTPKFYTFLGVDVNEKSMEVVGVHPSQTLLQKGDILVGAKIKKNYQISSIEDFIELSNELSPGAQVELTLSRGGRDTVVRLTPFLQKM